MYEVQMDETLMLGVPVVYNHALHTPTLHVLFGLHVSNDHTFNYIQCVLTH